MKKKIITLSAALMLLAGTVSASSINGDYNGNPIVKLIINGKEVASDVPAQIIDGTTMVPLRAVAEAMGGIVQFQPETYSVVAATKDYIQQNAAAPTQPTQQQAQPSQSKIKAPLSLYSNDGKTYLGKLTGNEYDTDSIFNQYGTYGSKYSATSIMNEYSTYGSPYSSTSAFNELASSPPFILDGDGNLVGYLTTNRNIKGGVSPVGLMKYLKDSGY